MKSSSTWKWLLFVLLSLEGLVYIYYIPPVNIASCGNVTATTKTTDIAKASTTNHIITILIWKWPFGHRFQPESCREFFHIENCHITEDRNEYLKAHGVLFHHRDICNDVSMLWKTKRPSLQYWVWMNMESPQNSVNQDGLDNLFNLTSSYRQDSDIWVPYGKITKVSEENTPFKIPPKDKLLCWIVNNWNENFIRVKYFYELSKHIKVETYGGYFSRNLSLKDYYKTLSSCKFYLSFENSIHKDYFTEKLFNPMKSGAVPIVLGPPRENYEEFIPANSFIHVDDFESPQQLAKWLTFVDKNPDIYEQYFTWRKHFTVKSSYFSLEHACLACDHIRRHNSYRVVKHLRKWFWG